MPAAFADFALWKASKPGEPEWESPWGLGRPGWHIECSVMASEVAGKTLDIHGGGCDLMFPHHDNEMAQSEAYWGHQQWVHYFMHTGHLHVEGRKMSKSLKNFFTIREVLEKYTARQMRLLFLINAWGASMNYSHDTMDEVLAKEKMLKEFFHAVKALERDGLPSITSQPQKWDDEDRSLLKAIASTQTAVHTALCNNFDTPAAVIALGELVRESNKYMSSSAPKLILVHQAASFVANIFKIFGIDEFQEWPFVAELGGQSEQDLRPILDAMCSIREQVW